MHNAFGLGTHGMTMSVDSYTWIHLEEHSPSVITMHCWWAIATRLPLGNARAMKLLGSTCGTQGQEDTRAGNQLEVVGDCLADQGGIWCHQNQSNSAG